MLPSGTGLAHAKATVECIKEWKSEEMIKKWLKYLGFDTCAVSVSHDRIFLFTLSPHFNLSKYEIFSTFR